MSKKERRGCCNAYNLFSFIIASKEAACCLPLGIRHCLRHVSSHSFYRVSGKASCKPSSEIKLVAHSSRRHWIIFSFFMVFLIWDIQSHMIWRKQAHSLCLSHSLNLILGYGLPLKMGKKVMMSCWCRFKVQCKLLGEDDVEESVLVLAIFISWLF